MGAVRPNETASAAGMFSFLRTTAGAFATGIIVSLGITARYKAMSNWSGR